MIRYKLRTLLVVLDTFGIVSLVAIVKLLGVLLG
jgi:hypothetical protein